jgi:hypothetical protein
VRIARDEAALIATDINLALMGEIGKIELACVASGRGGFLLVAATDGAFVRAKALSAREALRYAMASDEERNSLRLRAPYEPPQVASGVFYGLQPTGSACPVLEGRRLPAHYDNNQAELDGLILALRRHVALLTGLTVHEVLQQLLLDCELATGPAASADEDAGDCAGLCAESSKNRAPSGARDLLVIIDSENICDFFERAWRYGDVRRLRGETYGLRMEEALLLPPRGHVESSA